MAPKPRAFLISDDLPADTFGRRWKEQAFIQAQGRKMARVNEQAAEERAYNYCVKCGSLGVATAYLSPEEKAQKEARHATRWSRRGRILLGVYTMGISEIVRYFMKTRQVANTVESFSPPPPPPSPASVDQPTQQPD